MTVYALIQTPYVKSLFPLIYKFLVLTLFDTIRSTSPRSVQVRFTTGNFWDPEEPIKIYFLIWILEINSVTRASVEESAAKTMKST